MIRKLRELRNLTRRLLNLANTVENPVMVTKYVPGRLVGQQLELQKFTDEGYGELPVPPPELWLEYGRDEKEYVESGRMDIERMGNILQQAGCAMGSSGLPILDLGCGGGRMIRHLRELASQVEVWGIDISAPHIAWLKTHLTPPFRFAVGTTIPHLPFADNALGLVYCGSVFTHIDDFAETWFLEIRRVLAPGGMLYCTLHDEHARDCLIAEHDHPLAKSLQDHPYMNASAEVPDILVIGQSHESNVFYHSRYLKTLLNGMFEITSTTPRAYGYQTAWVLKKPGK